jgi:hypothetical protein
MSFLIESRLFAVLCQNVTHCGPDGLHSHSYNTIQVIPPGLSLDEAFAMVKKLQNAKENIPEESS